MPLRDFSQTGKTGTKEQWSWDMEKDSRDWRSVGRNWAEAGMASYWHWYWFLLFTCISARGARESIPVLGNTGLW